MKHSELMLVRPVTLVQSLVSTFTNHCEALWRYYEHKAHYDFTENSLLFSEALLAAPIHRTKPHKYTGRGLSEASDGRN